MTEKIINVRVDSETREQLAHLAFENDRSMTKQLKVLIKEAFEAQAKSKNVKA